MTEEYKRLIELSLALAHEYYQKMVRSQRIGDHHKAEWYRAQVKQHTENADTYRKLMEADNGKHNS